MTQAETSPETPDEEKFTGYADAASYLGLQANTLSSYSARGIGPRIDSHTFDEQYRRPVFLKKDLDEWKNGRPGQGARTDLIEAGA